MDAIIDEYHLETAMLGDGVRGEGRGKMLVSERINVLIDDRAVFLEFSIMAATGMYDNEGPGREHHHGHRHRGRECVIVAYGNAAASSRNFNGL